MYVTDSGSGCIHHIRESDGVCLRSIGSKQDSISRFETFEFAFDYPIGLYVTNKELIVADTYNNRILGFECKLKGLPLPEVMPDMIYIS
jgi:hypothetical protein